MLEVAHRNDIELEGACEGSLACSTVRAEQAHTLEHIRLKYIPFIKAVGFQIDSLTCCAPPLQRVSRHPQTGDI